MADNEYGPITAEDRQMLYDLDRMMIEYREALKDPDSEASRQQRIADELFSKPHVLWDK